VTPCWNAVSDVTLGFLSVGKRNFVTLVGQGLFECGLLIITSL
jgi:hypothetical protein